MLHSNQTGLSTFHIHMLDFPHSEELLAHLPSILSTHVTPQACRFRWGGSKEGHTLETQVDRRENSSQCNFSFPHDTSHTCSASLFCRESAVLLSPPGSLPVFPRKALTTLLKGEGFAGGRGCCFSTQRAF